VEADGLIARIETDKVTVDINAPEAGVIKSYFADIGDTVDVGADFYVLDTDGKAPEGGAAATPEPAAEATPPPKKEEPAAATPPPKAAPTPSATPA